MSAYYNCLISYDLNMGIYPITGPCFLSVIWQTIRIELMHMRNHFVREIISTEPLLLQPDPNPSIRSA